MLAVWERRTDVVAGYAWIVLLAAIVVGLVGGVIIAIAGEPASSGLPPPISVCTEPPCWDLDLSGIDLANLPSVISLFGYLLAVLLTVPAALAGAWELLGRRSTAGTRRVLPLVGAVLFVIGYELIPHLLLPCAVLPGVCEVTETGRDVVSRWHLLDHTLVGALPMAAFYRWMTGKWRPATR